MSTSPMLPPVPPPVSARDPNEGCSSPKCIEHDTDYTDHDEVIDDPVSTTSSEAFAAAECSPKSAPSLKSFTFGDEIAVGGYSTIFKGVTEDGDDIAIKVFHAEHDMHSAVREYDITRQSFKHFQLDHLFGIGEIDGLVHIRMPLFKGGELYNRIRARERKPYSEKEVCNIFVKILRDVDRLHKQGILHLDIKPENIMFVDSFLSSDTILADYGNARIVNDLTSEKLHEEIDGTVGYMAPEMLLGQPLGPACDVFSLGVVLYMLMTSQDPFFDRFGADETKDRTLSGRYRTHHKSFWGRSAELKQLVHGMLDPNPDSRMTVPDILQHPWVQQNGNVKTSS